MAVGTLERSIAPQNFVFRYFGQHYEHFHVGYAAVEQRLMRWATSDVYRYVYLNLKDKNAVTHSTWGAALMST